MHHALAQKLAGATDGLPPAGRQDTADLSMWEVHASMSTPRSTITLASCIRLTSLNLV